MNTNVNLVAPIGALALLGTAFLVFVTAVVLIQSLIVRKRTRARIVLVVAILVPGAYLGTMLAFSLASHEKLLGRGEEKHFCEIDCHLAYSVANVQQAKTLGGRSSPQGMFTIVTIKTRFDETTIGPRRGNALLYPNSRALTLVDQSGNRYSPSTETGTPLTNPLRPGESYTTDVAFDLPLNARAATLLINESDWITHFVVGHENSPLHKKTRFQIELPQSPA